MYHHQSKQPVQRENSKCRMYLLTERVLVVTSSGTLLVSEIAYYVSSWTLNPTHSLIGDGRPKFSYSLLLFVSICSR